MPTADENSGGAAMNPDRFAAIASDHELLAAYGDHFRRMVVAETAEYVAKTAAEINLLGPRLVAHFALEEAQIFPALLAANLGEPTFRAIAALEEEHRALRTEVDHLRQMLADRRPLGHHAPALREAMLDFYEKLRRHAAQEDALVRATRRDQP